MARDGFIIHDSTIVQASVLTDEELGRLLRLQIKYHTTNEEPLVEDRLLQVVFAEWKRRYDIDNAKYKSICDRNKTNGSKSKGAPLGNQNAKKSDNPKQPKTTQNNPNSEKNNPNEQKNNPKQPDIEKKRDEMKRDDNIEHTNVCTSDSSFPSESQLSVCSTVGSLFGDSDSSPTPNKVDYAVVRKTFNDIMERHNSSIPKVTGIKGSRQNFVNARIRENPPDGLSVLYSVFEKAAKSSFLNGGGGKGFVASFDWIVRPTNFQKILEGNYDDRPKYSPNNGGFAIGQKDHAVDFDFDGKNEGNIYENVLKAIGK